MIDVVEAHASLWERIHSLLLKNRLPQALLFVGPRHARVLQFVNRLIAILICQNEMPPCGSCRACHLLSQGAHPDIDYIRQEMPGGAIKIEQVRELQQTIYQTPQRSTHRFIVIDPADKMNNFAANALLKILEEPPEHTIFMLMAEQLSSIPATILSRCQTYVVPSPMVAMGIEPVNYLTIGQFYSAGSSRAELMSRSTTIIADLCALIEGSASPCTIAKQWSSYLLDDLLWLLYLITAQAIHYQLIDSSGISPENEKLIYFSCLLQSGNLYRQLDKISALIKKITHNVNMNQTLVLEDLLLGYLE